MCCIKLSSVINSIYSGQQPIISSIQTLQLIALKFRLGQKVYTVESRDLKLKPQWKETKPQKSKIDFSRTNME
jgi:hypothetical protein